MNYDPEGMVNIKRVESKKNWRRLKNKTKPFNAFMENVLVYINKNIKI